MDYTASRPFHGDRDKAFRLAESALTSLGFRITERTATALKMSGPGLNSSRQSPLLGASRLDIVSAAGELAIAAELDGVVRLSRFVRLFPIGLALFLGVGLAGLFTALFGSGIWVLGVGGAVGGNAILWLFLGPWMARRLRTRTDQALDTLLANLVAVGESG